MPKPFHLFVPLLLIFSSCFDSGQERQKHTDQSFVLAGNWPYAVTYEIFVQSFCDSDGDGIGDFQGLTSKLDYLQDLGIEAVWLMPINPSPSYHKYDVTDYKDIHPDYGTLSDFKNFLNEAHRRNIKVVMDLVINHTARDHPWFQEAISDSISEYRDYYVWANKDSIASQIAKKEVSLDSDNITQWHPVEGDPEHYYGFFWGGMPDLNFDNPSVQEKIFEIGRFWLEDVGVDGFRLDAAKHIFPDERATDNHQWWITFREEMEKVNPNVQLIGEVWSDAETVAPYLKGLPTLFNFDIGYEIINAVNTENGQSLVTRHKKIRDFYNSVTDEFVDATFITNHDQNRVMSSLNANQNKAKMAASLLLTLPGSPYIYYGEEIGMQGMKPDEHIREPFNWESGSASCETTWLKPQHTTEESVVALEVQRSDSASIFQHYKDLILARNNHPILTYGEIGLVRKNLPGTASFYRIYNEDSLFVVHNLTAAPVAQQLPAGFGEIYFQTSTNQPFKDRILNLPPYSSFVISNEPSESPDLN